MRHPTDGKLQNGAVNPVARMQSGIGPSPTPNPGMHPGYEVAGHSDEGSAAMSRVQPVARVKPGTRPPPTPNPGLHPGYEVAL